MRYRYLDDFRRGISVFTIFSYGIAVLGTPQCPPPNWDKNTFAMQVHSRFPPKKNAGWSQVSHVHELCWMV